MHCISHCILILCSAQLSKISVHYEASSSVGVDAGVSKIKLWFGSFQALGLGTDCLNVPIVQSLANSKRE